MGRRVKRNLLSLTFWLLVFQNCSPYRAADPDNFYFLAETPLYFYDVKLLEVENLRNRTVYRFDMVVSDAEIPTEAVEYKVLFIDPSSDGESEMCLSQSGQLESGENHVVFECHADVFREAIIARVHFSSRNRELFVKDLIL